MRADPPVALDGLDPQQSAAVTAPRGPVCILAGAGTGKTRTITRRIAHLVAAGQVAAGQVLAVTYTKRAAGEMQTRLRSLALPGTPACGTFHAAAMRQLRYFWPRVVGDVEWRLLDSKIAVVGRAASAVLSDASTDTVRDLASEIEWAKAGLIAPEDYPAAVDKHRRRPPCSAEAVVKVYRRYEELKVSAEGVLLDFDDLLLHTAAALEGHTLVAEEFRDRYRCFVVDEYQDVTPLQQRVLNAWLGERDDLTVVGDANQTIFSYNGATPGYLLDFSRRFPDATVVRLERDYRSTPQVVALANRVIGAARGRIAGTRLQLIGQRPAGPEPEFTEHDDESAEAAALADRIAQLLDDGVPAAEIAVLYRIHAQSEVYEQALAERGIVYQIRGGERFFQRAEVRRALAALRRAATRTDLPCTDVDDGLVTLVRAILAPLGLSATAPEGTQARERWESLVALVGLVRELVTVDPDLELTGLLRELAAREQAQQPPTVQGVTLASLHAAKGLEWDAVFLVGVTDSMLPIWRVCGDRGDVVDEAGLEEERRLFYVGITRAREHLRISWTTSYHNRPRRRSRFLDGLVPVRRSTVEHASVRRSPSLAVREQALARLLDWRREQAGREGVSVAEVLGVDTLNAICDRWPGSMAELEEIPGMDAERLRRYGKELPVLLQKSQNCR